MTLNIAGGSRSSSSPIQPRDVIGQITAAAGGAFNGATAAAGAAFSDATAAVGTAVNDATAAAGSATSVLGSLLGVDSPPPPKSSISPVSSTTLSSLPAFSSSLLTSILTTTPSINPPSSTNTPTISTKGIPSATDISSGSPEAFESPAITSSSSESSTSQSFSPYISSSSHSSILPQTSLGSTPPQEHTSRPSAAVIAGSVTGSVVALILVIIGISFHIRRRRVRYEHVEDQGQPHPVESWNSESNVTAEEKSPSDSVVSGPRPWSRLVPLRAAPDSDSASTEPIDSELVTMRETVTQVMEDVQRLQAQMERGANSTVGRTEAPPPAYAPDG